MSDFRIPVPDLPEDDFIIELDWDAGERKWTVSEKEQGLGKSWSTGVKPSPAYLTMIAQFFRVPPNLDPGSLVDMSPGELVLQHQQNSRVISVYAFLCKTCRQHWNVIRWDMDQQQWLSHGRTCDFGWHRGSPLTQEEIDHLGRARGETGDILRPPEAA
jgi:hypothetical protein